jgi:hypothetical protein
MRCNAEQPLLKITNAVSLNPFGAILYTWRGCCGYTELERCYSLGLDVMLRSQDLCSIFRCMWLERVTFKRVVCMHMQLHINAIASWIQRSMCICDCMHMNL